MLNDMASYDLLSQLASNDNSMGGVGRRRINRTPTSGNNSRANSPLYDQPMQQPTQGQQDIGYDPNGGQVNPNMLLQQMAGSGGAGAGAGALAPAGTFGAYGSATAVGTAPAAGAGGAAGFSPAVATATPAAAGTFGVGGGAGAGAAGGGAGASGGAGAAGMAGMGYAAIPAAVIAGKYYETNHPDSPLARTSLSLAGPSAGQMMEDPKLAATTALGLPFLNGFIRSDKSAGKENELQMLSGMLG